MKDVIFNPFLEECKFPVGAVEVNKQILINVKINNQIKISTLVFVIHKDYEEQNMYYTMNRIKEDELYATYSFTFILNEIGIYWYNFEFYDVYGKHYISYTESLDGEISDEIRCYQLSIHKKFTSRLDWFKGKVIYQILVDRFCNGGIDYVKDYAIMHNDWNELPNYKQVNGEILNNDFFGGDIPGIISKLDYLKSLNIGVIYLNPIFTAYSNHKYDVANYMEIDPMFGTEEDFVKLCVEAKKRDIAIVLDGVFNHTGSDSIYFNKNNRFNLLGAYQSKESPYYDWYKFIEYPDKYECWWNFLTLPAINQKNEVFLEYITGKNGVLNKWYNLGAKGIRLDVVDELEDNFLNKIVECSKQNSNENIIIGEVWEDASNKIAYKNRRQYFNGSQLDCTMNYPFRKSIIDYIRNDNYIGLRNQIRSIINNYPKHSLDCAMNIIGTHDTVRLLTSFTKLNYYYLSKDEQAEYEFTRDDYYNARQMLKMATAIQFTLPGVPSIYYGDEAGLQGFKDPFCRKTMPWDKFDDNIFEWYKKLSEIRKDSVYIDGSYNEEICENNVFAFNRKNNDTKITTIVNNSNYKYTYYIEKGFDLIEEIDINEYVVMNRHTVKIIKHKV